MNGNNQVVKYNLTDAALKKLAEKYALLTGIKDGHDYKAVTSAIADCRGKRGDVTAQHKMLKAGALAYGRACDAEKNRIISAIEVVENRLKAIKEYEDSWREAIRADKEWMEARRIFGIQTKIDAIRGKAENLLQWQPLELRILVDSIQAMPIEESEYHEFVSDAEEARGKTLEKIGAHICVMAEREKEAAARQAEDERQKKEAERLAAENAKLAAERQEYEKKVRELRKKQEAIERAASERAAAETARVKAEAEAKAKVEREVIAAAKAAEKARVDAERREALRPDVEKLERWAAEIVNMTGPAISDRKLRDIVDSALLVIQEQGFWVKSQCDELTKEEDE